MKHITPWFEAKATPDLSQFPAILSAFWQEATAAIDGLDAQFPAGHFEAEHGASRVQSYRDALGTIGCLRVARYTRGKTTRIHIFECLLAKPATKPATLGLRAWCIQPSGGRISSGIETPTAWSTLLEGGLIRNVSEGAALPHFDQVLAVIRESEGMGSPPAAPADLNGNTAILTDLTDERDYYRQLASNQRDLIRSLDQKLKAAQAALSQKDPLADLPLEAAFEPRDLEHLPLWAEDHEEALVVLPRAYNGAKRSLYQDDEAIFKALEFLAGPYRQNRMGELSLEAYQQRLADSGLRLSGSATYMTATAEGDAYFVRYKGQRKFLEWHLVKGGGRDPRFCLRIYFFWDAEDKKVIVGWLPSHLDNSLT